MSLIRTKALVLRRTNFKEADRILLLLTPEGVYSAIARGVRKEKSKLAGSIELFARSDVVLRQGKGSLFTMTSARLDVYYENIIKEYDAMMWLYDVMKIVAQNASETGEVGWFDVVDQVYQGCQRGIALQCIQAWFYVQCAELMGYGLNLSADTVGREITQNVQYQYDVSERGLRLYETGDITSDHIKLLRLMQAKPLGTVALVGGVESILPECLHISRMHAAVL